MSLIEQQLKLIDASLSELEKLKREVGRLEEIRNEIEVTRKGVDSLPKELMDAFEKIKILSVSFVESLGKATKNYIDGNNNLFTKNLKELSKRNEELEKHIERLEKIDLEMHFDKLQKTLAEIFGAINAINQTLTNIFQTLTRIVQTLGNIQTTLDTDHKEAKQLLNSFRETSEKHLTDIEKQATKNMELLESKIKSLADQNDLLKKEIKTNRIFQIVGFVIAISILVYLIVR